MAFGLGVPCGACGCSPPCAACTKTCTNPHTGSAFAVVYTRYFGGAEAGNPTDGYLTASGDSDTSDPYDGMDGTGPWYQRVSGGFSVGGSGDTSTRFPCTYRVSFWRNSYTLGASTIPPPSSSLTENVIEVIVTQGALVFPDGRVVTPADGAVAFGTVPLVSVGGDASGSDPRSYEGTVSVAPQCMNVETVFTLRATIRWNTKKRQHVLYGKVRECYEDPPNPCASSCGGSGKPQTLYVTLTSLSFSNAKYNYAGDGTSPGASDTVYTPAILSDWQSLLTSAVVVDRITNLCTQWQECVGVSGGLCNPCVTVVYNDSGPFMYAGLTGGLTSSGTLSVYLMSKVNYLYPGVLSGCNEWVLVSLTCGNYEPCSPFDKSGSATGKGVITSNLSSYGGISFDASCNWRVKT